MGITFDMKLTAPLPEMKKEVRRRVSRAVRATALAIEASAKDAAPVDTGFLKNSIHTKTISGDTAPTIIAASNSLFLPLPEVKDELEAYVGVGAEYGLFVEVGTHYSPGQPFMEPAVQVQTSKFIGRIRRALEGE